jgi:DNA-binding MarR family transcriptional regulator
MLGHIDNISGIGLHLDLVLRKVQDAYLRAFQDMGIDMTIEQWVILYRIHQLGDDASQAEIVRSNFRNRATTSRVIGGLERKGWISKKRFKGDKKRFRLVLTPLGTDIIAQIEPRANALRKLAVKDLNPEDFHIFLSVLDKIGDNYSE